MEDVNHQDNNIEMNNNDTNNEDNFEIIDENEGYDEDVVFEFNKDIFQRLKQNDPSVTNVHILLNCDACGKCHFNIDWEENGDVISDNIHLKRLNIEYKGVPFHRSYEQNYMLGEEGHNLPTRQQLQNFFSCIHRNSSIQELGIHGIVISNKFGCGLIEGLSGHPSLTKLEISNGALGSIGCDAVGKVLKHPQSKLKDLRLRYCKLDDDRLGIVCNTLLGNSTIKRFCLNGNSITSSGWRHLSTVISDPNCKLIDLELRSAEIDTEGANALEYALSGSTMKALDLSFNRKISTTAWRSLLNQIAHTSIEKLNLCCNYIDDDGLAALDNICDSIKSIDLSKNSFIGDPGWQSFFSTLQTRGTQLKKLVLSHNHIGNVGLAALCNLLINMASLKTLELDVMSHSYDDIYGLGSINSQGWVSLFTTLQDSNLNFVELKLSDNQIDDEGIRHLVPLVSSMSSLKHLSLNNNRLVTPVGWQAFTGYLQRPNLALRELHLGDNEYNKDTMVALTSALARNKTLKSLRLGGYNEDDYEEEEEVGDDYVGELNLISRRGWDAVSKLLCNKSSILDTYTSNHTLQELGYYIPDALADCLVPYLVLNGNQDKTEVARQKILQTHFSSQDNDTSKMQEFLDMELEIMPSVITWIGRPTPMGWSGSNVSGLSLMFNLMRRLPDLFDSTAQTKQAAAKGKLEV